jgi:uncharacterized YigZ family protein
MGKLPDATQRVIIPQREARAEIVIDRSRFIACAGPAFSVEQARGFISAVKREFPDASHHVPAFMIGHGAAVISHCTDDGEPAGTAGRPVLVVLQGSGLSDAVVVVTRYFGGIKLGTGGLVKAYTQAAQAVLNALPRAEKVSTYTIMLAFEYTYFERMRQYASAHQAIILEEDFGADVTLTLQIREEKFENFQMDVKDLTRGAVEAIIMQRDPETIMALTDDTDHAELS